MSIAKILGGIQRDVEESECRITSGVVESVSPLRIKKDKLSITKDYLIVSPIVQLVGLKKGQKVVLLQANKQQTYYILEILNESVEQVISKLIKTNDATLEASLKAYVNNKVKTDVPTNAKFTDTITTINGKTGAIAKADITALGIPAQDTQTTINGKTGAITKGDITALGIPAQDTVTSINGKTGAITKADITALGIPTQDTVTTVNGKTGTVTPQDLANAVSGNLYASSNAEVFGLYGSTHAYMGFYANGTNRSAFLGNASPDNKNLYINNETSGADILLATSGSGKIRANGEEILTFPPTNDNVNFNTFTEPGFHYFSGVTNGPIGSSSAGWYAIIIKASAGHVVQFTLRTDIGTSNPFYIRRGVASGGSISWGRWGEIALAAV